ncbi:MAG: DNA polymerase IV [candidate division Zixibacteria bacterium HGW-Zixibacteria-1]|nr:MAG: DNA polymerase IV [candidate division Zixibacteria bacterium HGW-Zixibacteria-1]
MGGIDRTKEWDKVIMHVDMDAFFAAFEVRNCPHLKDKPVIVGGFLGHRSVVSTCSYEARKFGVHSGMPITQAKRLCPQAVFIPGTMRGYVYTSAMLQKIFEHYSPIVEPFSVDEAFLDLTGCHRIFGTVENLVAQMKAEIKEKLSLTCSVGIAPTRLIAKMGSGENKPDGLTIMDRDDFKRLFYPRPVIALWGVGESTRQALAKIGIWTVGDLAAKKEKELTAHFGKNGEWLSVVACGLDSSEVYNYENRPNDKSMSHETTMLADLSEIDKIYSTLLWLSDKVARRLRKENYWGRTVTVKIRSSSFQTITRDRTLTEPTDQAKVIFETAKRLIPRDYGPRIKVRLLGIRVSHLEKKVENCQLSLIENSALNKIKDTSKAIDQIRERFGESVIKYAGTKL